MTKTEALKLLEAIRDGIDEDLADEELAEIIADHVHGTNVP